MAAENQQHLPKQEATIDDDEEKLVRQVLAENPVEERGVRDEWAGKVGWGRKEDVLGLRGGVKRNEKKVDLADVLLDKNEGVAKEDTPTQEMAQKGALWVVFFGVVLFAIRFVGVHSRKKERRSVRRFSAWPVLLLVAFWRASDEFGSLAFSSPLKPESQLQQHHTYIALYKPALTLCSFNSDHERAKRKNRAPRETLADLNLPLSTSTSTSTSNNRTNLHICGRLDRDSEGLLLLTDDGQFTHQTLSMGCPKTYWALVQGGRPSPAALDEMRRGGLEIRGAITRPPIQVSELDASQLKLVSTRLPKACSGMNRRAGCCWIQLILDEGRNRQVRRISAAAGHPTIRLVRVAIGSLSLFDLQLFNDECSTQQPGNWRYIQRAQVL